MKGILGRKVGMTQVFSEHGRSIPVSIIEIQPNIVTAVMTKDKNGYDALQLSAFDRREKTSTKPLIGHLKKANTSAKYFIREVRGMTGFVLGQTIDGSIFVKGQFVDVEGVSKGHGFQGNIKRYGQHIGPKSHGGGGGSQPTRQVGSLGDMVSNRVFKGMTMPGHMGVDKVTIQNLEVIHFDEKANALLVKGSVPGPKKGFVIVTDAIKGLPAKNATKIIDNGKELEVKVKSVKTTKKIEKVTSKPELKIEVKQEKVVAPMTSTPKNEVRLPAEDGEDFFVEEDDVVSVQSSETEAPTHVKEEIVDEALEMEMLEHGEEE